MSHQNPNQAQGIQGSNLPTTPPHSVVVPQSNSVVQPGGYQGVPLGRVRGTGVCILLSIVTLGIYSLVWYFKVHQEMKNHTGQGLGGGIALLLAVFVGIAMPFITASEVGNLYERRGQSKPVSGATGLWYLPGMIIIVGPIVWFIKTNGAINGYWRSFGAR